jgi:regulator of RNase E activity RraB
LVTNADLSRQKQGDREVIAALKDAGSDLSKPHSLEHHFVSPSRQGLERLRAWGVESGLSAGPIAEGEYQGRRYFFFDFIVPTIPTLEEVFKYTGRFLSKAAEFGVEYDGWGCPVVSRSPPPDSPGLGA